MLTKSWNKGIDQAHSIHQCLFLLTWIGKKVCLELKFVPCMSTYNLEQTFHLKS